MQTEGGIAMTKVVVTNDLDKAIRKFKVQVARSGVPSELKKHKCYTKPGVKKREEKKVNTRNSRKKNRRRD